LLLVLSLPGPSCGRGLRSESRAIAIAMAPASTARPASCPPISRGSSGTIAEAVSARTGRCFLAAGKPRLALGLGLESGETVGNSPAGLPGVRPVPVAGGTDTGGSVTVDAGGGVGVAVGGALADVTVTEPDALKDRVLFPEAVAVSSTCSPLVAALWTQEAACNSSACPAGRVPIPHFEVPEPGQTVKCGDFTCPTCATRNEIVTDLLVPCVLQTQTAKPAS
jgi:hypothetical protein